MDNRSRNALTDPYSGASTQPAYPGAGRITGSRRRTTGSPDGTGAAADADRRFFGVGDPDGWNYRRMILHYAALAASAGGVDASLIGSELKGLTPCALSLRGLSGGDAARRTGRRRESDRWKRNAGDYARDWTEYGAHVVTPDPRHEVRFPSSAVGVVRDRRSRYRLLRPVADWRDGRSPARSRARELDYDLAYLAGNLRGGRPMTSTTPTIPRASRRPAAPSLMGSASRGSFAPRICGIGGRMRIASASAALSFPLRPAG